MKIKSKFWNASDLQHFHLGKHLQRVYTKGTSPDLLESNDLDLMLMRPLPVGEAGENNMLIYGHQNYFWSDTVFRHAIRPM